MFLQHPLEHATPQRAASGSSRKMLPFRLGPGVLLSFLHLQTTFSLSLPGHVVDCESGQYLSPTAGRRKIKQNIHYHTGHICQIYRVVVGGVHAITCLSSDNCVLIIIHFIMCLAR